MEGIAAASSIAGILSLAGQTTSGIVKLHTFFKDVSSASRTIDRFLQNINQLIKLIEDVKAVLQNVANSSTLLCADVKIAALEIQLEDCSNDVYRWLKVAREHHPGFRVGTKAGFKKFWVAVNKGDVKGILEDIREHRHGIVASLSVLGRAMSITHSTQMSVIQETLEEAAQDDMTYRRDSMQQLLKIDSLEKCSRASLQYGHESMVTLASIASSVANIERRLSLARHSSAQSMRSETSRIQSTRHHAGLLRKSSINDSGIGLEVGPQPYADPSPAGKQSRIERVKPKKMFALGGSSESGDEVGSVWCPAPIVHSASRSNSSGRIKRHVSFRQECAERTIFEDPMVDEKVFETDEDDEREESEPDDDVETFDWEDSMGCRELRRSTTDAMEIPQLSPSQELSSRKGGNSDTEVFGGSIGGESDENSIDRVATTLLEASTPFYPTTVASYISKSTLLQRTEQQISLLSLYASDNPDIQQHLDGFSKHLAAIKRCLTRLRAQSLREGHSLHLIDEILTSCKMHDPVTGLRLQIPNIAIRHGDLLALRKRTLKQAILSTSQSYTKRDRINRWLFQNLQNSPENAALHRSMMVSTADRELDEKSWARTVVKFWSIDEAATGEEYEAASTNEADGSYAKSLENADEEKELELELGMREFGMPKLMERIITRQGSTTFLSRIEFPVRKWKAVNKTGLGFAAGDSRSRLLALISPS